MFCSTQLPYPEVFPRSPQLHGFGFHYVNQPEYIFQGDPNILWELMTEEESVNIQDEFSATPYTYLLLAKEIWQDDPDKLNYLDIIDKHFIGAGADADLALAGLVVIRHKWNEGGLRI